MNNVENRYAYEIEYVIFFQQYIIRNNISNLSFSLQFFVFLLNGKDNLYCYLKIKNKK